jgi:MscS family membrane protein
LLTVIAWTVSLPESLAAWSGVWGSFGATLLAWLCIGAIVYLIFRLGLPLLCRWIPGEVDDILVGILAWPALWLTFVFGTLNSLSVLGLAPDTVLLVRRCVNTVLVGIVAYILWRLVHDVAIYYGRRFVKKTESRIDDTIMPAVRIFGSIVLVIAGVSIILILWDINVTSVFIGAGALSLIVGLALQEPLRNIFSGLSLLADAPFATGDLITLNDGKVLRVEFIGLRATQLYNLAEHATVFLPNAEMAKSLITNITRPTIELKSNISLRVPGDTDLARLRHLLEEIAASTPGVVGELKRKINVMTQYLETFPETADKDRYARMIQKLKLEDALNGQCLELTRSLREMATSALRLEENGFNAKELEQLDKGYVNPIGQMISGTAQCARDWTGRPDPYLEGAFPDEIAQERDKYELQNTRLAEKWARLVSAIARHEPGTEMRFDDRAIELAGWIEKDYKSFPEPWKEPDISLGNLEKEAVTVTLHFFVDDIRLEHNKRRDRITTDLTIAIARRLPRAGISLA